MCGRFQARRSAEEIARLFDVQSPLPNFPPTWNAAPTDTLPVVRFNPEKRERSLDLLRWGLVPLWSKDLKTGFKAINARAESIATSGMFKDAFEKRRCLVPADAFYEWAKKPDDSKQPYAIGLASGEMFAFAGLWERWKDPATGEWVRTFTIATATPNSLCAPIHNRMPVILDPSDFPRWLGEVPSSPEFLSGLLQPYPSELMKAWPVSAAVGNVKNNGPELAEPIALAEGDDPILASVSG